MKRDRIETLSKLMPTYDQQYIVQKLAVEQDWDDPRLNEMLDLHDAPDFGWQFVRSFVDCGRELPAAVHEPILREVYAILRGRKTPSPVMLEVLGLHGSSASVNVNRGLMKALLMLPSVSLEEVARVTGFATEVVRSYEQLCFNVRERLDDGLYIAKLVYPEPKRVILEPDDPANVDIETLLLRAARHFGPDVAVELAFCGGDYRNTEYYRKVKMLQEYIGYSSGVHCHSGRMPVKQKPPRMRNKNAIRNVIRFAKLLRQ